MSLADIRRHPFALDREAVVHARDLDAPVLQPLAHLGRGDGAQVVAAHPAGGVEPRLGGRRALVGATRASQATAVVDDLQRLITEIRREEIAGLPPPDAALAVNVVSLVGEERTLKGSYIGTCVPSRDIPRFIRLFKDGRLPVDRLLSGTLTLDQINPAFDALADGMAVRQIIRF